MAIKYTRAELITLLKDFEKENNRIPQRREVKQRSSVIREFGSWNNALQETFGKVKRGTPSPYSKKEVDDMYLNKAVNLGRVPLLKEICKSDKERYRASYRKYYSNYSDLIAQLTPQFSDQLFIYSKAEIVKILIDFKNKHNRLPKSNEIQQREAIARIFGSFSHALDEIFGDVNVHQPFTKKEIIDIFFTKYQEIGELPNFEQLCPEMYYTFRLSMRKYFKNYEAMVLELAPELYKKEKFYDKTRQDYSENELIEMYRSFSDKLGYPATIKDIDNSEELPKFYVFSRNFDGMSDLREKAKMQNYHGKSIEVTKKELVYKMINLYKKYGRRLTNKELRENHLSVTTICRRFKTTKIGDAWEEIENYELFTKHK